MPKRRGGASLLVTASSILWTVAADDNPDYHINVEVADSRALAALNHDSRQANVKHVTSLYGTAVRDRGVIVILEKRPGQPYCLPAACYRPWPDCAQSRPGVSSGSLAASTLVPR